MRFGPGFHYVGDRIWGWISLGDGTGSRSNEMMEKWLDVDDRQNKVVVLISRQNRVWVSLGGSIRVLTMHCETE